MKPNFDSFKVLMFDCYGTIIDWETGILLTLKPILSNHGIVLFDDDILKIYAEAEARIEARPYRSYGSVLKSVLHEFGDRLGFSPSDTELVNFSRAVRNWPPFSDSSEALKALQSKFKLVILSNVDDDLFELSRQKIDIDFHRVFTAQQIGSYKPSLRNFQYALEHLEFSKVRILHVAQSLFHDIAPAKELGLSTVWVNRRMGQAGFGATPSAQAKPDLEVPDLRSLALAIGLME